VPACVVLLVSGRPQVITDQLGDIDALVASWLPGSEGDGVADVLFGRVPFTGRLPVTWPATVEQVPINVGDAAYQPLFPYGWGLRAPPATTSLIDAVQARVVAGQGGPGWQSTVARADQARTAGDDAEASRLLRGLLPG
jgi:beta-glucosidase